MNKNTKLIVIGGVGRCVTELGEDGSPIDGAQNVVGPEESMRKADLVEVGEGAGERSGEAQRVDGRPRRGLGERAAGHRGDGEAGRPVLIRERRDRDHARVTRPKEQLGLTPKVAASRLAGFGLDHGADHDSEIY